MCPCARRTCGCACGEINRDGERCHVCSQELDTLIAKLDVWAPTRLEALRRCRRALEELIVEGPATNIDLLHQVMYHPQFIHGTYTTSFMDEHLQEILGWDAEQKKVSAW